MKTFKLIFSTTFILLCGLALLIDAMWVYYKFFNKDITIGTNYITTVQTGAPINADDLTEEEEAEYNEAYFLEANYYSNDNDNGTELQELKINFASDFVLGDYYSTGMQWIGNFKAPIILGPTQTKDTYIEWKMKYYDGYDDIYWKSTMNLNRETDLIISIDGQPYSITLDKYTPVKILGFEVYRSNVMRWGHLFESIFKAIKTNNQGYGNWYLKMDLSKFFTVKTYNEQTGNFEYDDQSDQVFNYVMVKVNYDANGVRNSNQSFFGIIDNDPSYDLEEIDYETEYWQERIVYNLTENDLNLRYSSTYDGYFASLKLSTKSLFDAMPRTKLNLVINLDNINLAGFDYNAFENVELDTVTITSAQHKTFHLLQKSLYNTDIKAIKRSANITLNFETNATNNAYAEVII